jgi:hypothetical protein
MRSLFIDTYNAWDGVAYHVFAKKTSLHKASADAKAMA